jgi:hypothetical protein
MRNLYAFFKKATNKYVYIVLHKYSKTHNLLGNNHTGAVEQKGRTDAASHIVSNCCNLFLCMLFSSDMI